MIESGSSIQTFMDCPKRYEFRYVKLLDTIGYSSALGLGTFLHAEIERWAGGRVDSVEAELARFISSKNADSHPQIRLDRLTAERIFQMWQTHWDGEHPYSNSKYEWLEAEAEWGFDIPGGHRHVGKRDALVRERETGAIFLYELKTAADRGRERYVHKLEIDRQVSSNLLALQKAGVEVAGALYDISWKPAIRRLTGRKSKPDETAEEFADRMVEAIRAEPHEYFQRQIVYRSDRALLEHGKDLTGQFGLIEKCQRDGYPRNTGACDNYGLCPFFSACIEGRQELEDLYARKDRKLPELSKETQHEGAKDN